MLGGAGYGALMMNGAVRSRVDRVMGAADDAGDWLGDASSSVADAGRHTVAKAQGNPLAVGLTAFAAVKEEAAGAAAHVRDDATHAVDEVKSSAQDARDNVAGQS